MKKCLVTATEFDEHNEAPVLAPKCLSLLFIAQNAISTVISYCYNNDLYVALPYREG